MTSSSDSELLLHRRRLFVHGIPQRCSPAAIKEFFAAFGAVTGVHSAKHSDYAFVTFEEEAAANRVLAQAENIVFHGKKIQVLIITKEL